MTSSDLRSRIMAALRDHQPPTHVDSQGLPRDEFECCADAVMAAISAGVTLEEMTRRRDGWRQRCETALKVIRSVKAQRDALAERAVSAESRADRYANHVRQLQGELAAAQAEARRYAEECGRLRDQVALKDEEISRLTRLAAGF